MGTDGLPGCDARPLAARPRTARSRAEGARAGEVDEVDCPVEAVEAVEAALQRLTRAVDRYRAVVHERDGLTGSELAALAALADRGPLRGVDLGAVTGLTPGSITALVDRLAARGLLERHRPPENKRVVAVALTPWGGQLLGRVHGPIHDMIAELVGCKGIDPALLHEGLSALAAALGTLTPFSPASPDDDVPDHDGPGGGAPPTPAASSISPPLAR